MVRIQTYNRARRAGRLQRRGAAAVEFALVAPLLALLIVGVCEVSRAIMVKSVLTDAARHGCRTAIRPATSNTTIINDVNQILSLNHINTAAATVTILVNGQAVNASTAKANDLISVRVSVPFGQVSWTAGFFFIGSQALESETLVMLRQG
jgi:Flp pilus assembly protein TadG